MKDVFMGIIIGLLVLITSPVQASSVEVYTFDNSQQEKIYTVLVDELRCLVCQNQNIADSNAELAQDMRRKTYELIKQGQSKQQIANYMADRYGDFVLYRPPFKLQTAILWIAPFLLLVLAVWLLLGAIQVRQKSDEKDQLSEQQLQEATDLLSSAKSHQA